MTDSISVSVILCAYTLGRAEQLYAAVRSIQAQDPQPAEIIVVSDHNPRLAAHVRTAFPSIVTLLHDGAKGLSGARNTGVAHARGDIIAFIDDDAVMAATTRHRNGIWALEPQRWHGLSCVS